MALRLELCCKLFKLFERRGVLKILDLLAEIQVSLVIRGRYKYWTSNYETANKNTYVRLILKDWFLKKAVFGLRICETTDKKTANNEDRR